MGRALFQQGCQLAGHPRHCSARCPACRACSQLRSASCCWRPRTAPPLRWRSSRSWWQPRQCATRSASGAAPQGSCPPALGLLAVVDVEKHALAACRPACAALCRTDCTGAKRMRESSLPATRQPGCHCGRQHETLTRLRRLAHPRRRLDENLTFFEGCVGTCERILRTPIPLRCASAPAVPRPAQAAQPGRRVPSAAWFGERNWLRSASNRREQQLQHLLCWFLSPVGHGTVSCRPGKPGVLLPQRGRTAWQPALVCCAGRLSRPQLSAACADPVLRPLRPLCSYTRHTSRFMVRRCKGWGSKSACPCQCPWLLCSAPPVSHCVEAGMPVA